MGKRLKGKTDSVPYEFTAEMRDLMRRRTMPFLDVIGLQTIPLAHIVQEAYLQGLNDAIDAMQRRERMLANPPSEP